MFAAPGELGLDLIYNGAALKNIVNGRNRSLLFRFCRAEAGELE